jgi:hypothetical protein
MDVIAKKKKELLASSEQHKLAINNDLKALSNRTERLATDGLMTVGVLLSAFALYKLLSSKKSGKSSKTGNRLLRVLKQQTRLYILNEGRKKIVEHINTLDGQES